MTPPRAKAAAPDARPEMATLRVAVYEFLAANGRLRSQNQGLGRLTPPGGIEGLVRLMDGEMTPSQLAKAWARSPATVSEQLDRLEANGIVRRRRDDKDGRVVWVSLTRRGRTQVTSVKDEWDEHFRAALAELPDRSIVAAAQVLQHLAGLFNDLGEHGAT